MTNVILEAAPGLAGGGGGGGVGAGGDQVPGQPPAARAGVPGSPAAARAALPAAGGGQ